MKYCGQFETKEKKEQQFSEYSEFFFTKTVYRSRVFYWIFPKRKLKVEKKKKTNQLNCVNKMKSIESNWKWFVVFKMTEKNAQLIQKKKKKRRSQHWILVCCCCKPERKRSISIDRTMCVDKLSSILPNKLSNYRVSVTTESKNHHYPFFVRCCWIWFFFPSIGSDPIQFNIISMDICFDLRFIYYISSKELEKYW